MPGACFCYLLFAMTQLSHVDEHGRVRMVDTGNKEITSRRAVASARVLMTHETVAALTEHRTPKGDPLETARLAGIMIVLPLCGSFGDCVLIEIADAVCLGPDADFARDGLGKRVIEQMFAVE